MSTPLPPAEPEETLPPAADCLSKNSDILPPEVRPQNSWQRAMQQATPQAGLVDEHNATPET